VIGIGGGPACDGQVLVMHDLLGLSLSPPPKFVKVYASLADVMRTALRVYKEDVERGRFPAPEHCYGKEG
ncbi:MAG: 3-methyl-2-oxobutanoate hydroxymethyltransferase, partial [Kiritimatiellaeota bacterium]|nr:3-methyl-2-oxobutanoate hydroxymethyltransferase [Kiritimatiellota bacterium]